MKSETTHKGKPVTIKRPLVQGDAEFDPAIPKVIIRYSDGREEVVVADRVSGITMLHRGKPVKVKGKLKEGETGFDHKVPKATIVHPDGKEEVVHRSELTTEEEEAAKKKK